MIEKFSLQKSERPNRQWWSLNSPP